MGPKAYPDDENPTAHTATIALVKIQIGAAGFPLTNDETIYMVAYIDSTEGRSPN